MNDDRIDLASALLDGELSSADRARLDADPTLHADVAAEAERMRAVRHVLAEVEPPAISTREQHLAAALEAWDRLPASEFGATQLGGTSSDTATPLPSRRRRRHVAPAWGSWALGAAAAVVVVAGAGIALRNLDLGGDDQSDAAFDAAAAPEVDDENASEVDINAEQAAEELSAADAPAQEESSEADQSRGAEASTQAADDAEAAVEAAPLDEADDNPGDEVAEAAPADDGGIEASPVGEGESSVEVAPPAEADEQPIETVDELIDLAVDAQIARRSAAANARSATTIASDLPLCSDELGVDFIVAPIAYRGVPAVVGIDDDTNRVVAYTDDCAAILQRLLPAIDDE